MEFNQNLEIAMFVSCVVSSCIHFPVLLQEGEAEAGADDLLAARQDNALPPAETFPINKFKQLLKFFKSCVEYFICVNQEFEKKGKIKDQQSSCISLWVSQCIRKTDVFSKFSNHVLYSSSGQGMRQETNKAK